MSEITPGITPGTMDRSHIESGILRYVGMVWNRIRVRSRHVCWLCGVEISKRQFAYRPLTNGEDRMQRICLDCAEKK